MASKILYNKETLEIIKCQSKPFGGGVMPSFGALCKSAFLAEDEKDLMDTCIINERLFTNEAKEKYRIIDGEAIEKPKPIIAAEKKVVEINKDNLCAISLKLINTLENENFEKIKISINDFNVDIPLKNNKGKLIVQLTEKDTYLISCNDDNFRNTEVEVKAV